MGYQQAFAVSAAGMNVEHLRVDVATMNLAHANTVIGPAGGGYRPLRVVAQVAPGVAQPFAARYDQWMQATAVSLDESTQPARQVLDPGHPMADLKGMVSYPGVDTTTEMMTLMSALRAYEANVSAMNVSRAMALKALDIGGQQ